MIKKPSFNLTKISEYVDSLVSAKLTFKVMENFSNTYTIASRQNSFTVVRISTNFLYCGRTDEKWIFSIINSVNGISIPRLDLT